MTPRQRLAAIARGMQADIDGYAALRGLLGRQFEAALRHDTGAMRDVAEAISEQVAVLERHRSERVQHATALSGGGVPASMPELFQRVGGPARLQLSGMWSTLEAQVHDCKAQNVRNCRLIMEQGELMRRVLVGEDSIYVPA